MRPPPSPSTRSRRPRTWLLALLLLAAGRPLLAQSDEAHRVTHWTIANGLPQGTINAIVQAPDGELWIATFGGLLRFDGVEFRVVDVERDDLPPTNRFTALTSDGRGGLWASTQGGHAVHMERGRVLDVVAPTAGVTQGVAIVRDPSGGLWLRADNGSLVLTSGGTSRMILGSDSQGDYHSLCIQPDGSPGMAMGAEYVRLGAQGQSLEALTAPSRILSVVGDHEQGAWLGLEQGVARVREGLLLPLDTEPVLEGPVSVLIPDGLGGAWLGTEEGPRHLVPMEGPGERYALRPPPLGMPLGFEVRSLALDREGNLWVGSFGQGLVRLTPRRVKLLGVERGATSSIVGDGSGGTWIAFGCEGLAHLPADGVRLQSVPLIGVDGTPKCVQCLGLDPAGRLLLGQGPRLLRLEGGMALELDPAFRFDSAVRALIVEDDGSVCVGTVGGGLTRLDAGGRVLERHEVPGGIVSLVRGGPGVLWIGGVGTVCRLEEGRLESFGSERGVPRGDVRDLHPDPDGTLWIATYGGGLGRLAGGRATQLTSENGLPDDSLSRILEDHLGRLWLLSNRGLIVAAREELLDVLEGRAQRFHPIVLGSEVGMPEANFGSPAGYRDPQGRLWFGTIAGAAVIDPERFPFNRIAPTARIERVFAEGEELPVGGGGEVEIPPGTRRVGIEFTAFSLTVPERVRFRYRLAGFDDEWLDSDGLRRVSFTALSPGRYTFSVAARNEDGVWGEAPASLQLRVLPSWWQTGLFRFTAALATVALLVGLHRRRIGVIHRRARTLLEATEGRVRAEERESRLREELAHVARVATAGELATSLAHEVNQPLAAIVANADAGRRFLARSASQADGDAQREIAAILVDIASEGRRASEVIKRLREFLVRRATERSPLQLEELVRRTLPLLRRELEQNRVITSLRLAPGLPAVTADAVQLQQVVVNLVKNACEALGGVTGARRVEVRTRSLDGRVLMEIRDTGPGLAPEVVERLFQPYVTTKPDGMGLGLPICRTIVEAHGGRLTALAADGGGVIFRVDLPPSTPETETSPNSQ